MRYGEIIFNFNSCLSLRYFAPRDTLQFCKNKNEIDIPDYE